MYLVKTLEKNAAVDRNAIERAFYYYFRVLFASECPILIKPRIVHNGIGQIHPNMIHIFYVKILNNNKQVKSFHSYKIVDHTSKGCISNWWTHERWTSNQWCDVWEILDHVAVVSHLIAHTEEMAFLNSIHMFLSLVSFSLPCRGRLSGRVSDGLHSKTPFVQRPSTIRAMWSFKWHPSLLSFYPSIRFSFCPAPRDLIARASEMLQTVTRSIWSIKMNAWNRNDLLSEVFIY